MDRYCVWGAGKAGKNFLNKYKNLVNPEFVADNNPALEGKLIEGVRVVKPDIALIKALGLTVIIAAPTVEKGIKEELSTAGYLKYISAKEFIGELLKKDAVSEAVVSSLAGHILKEQAESDVIIRARKEYEEYQESVSNQHLYSNIINDVCCGTAFRRVGYAGYCSSCASKTIFEIDFTYSYGGSVNWRENVKCIRCGRIGRLRKLISYIKGYDADIRVFIYERITKTYEILSEHFRNITGSEYFGPQYASGEYVNGIMHQDAMKLGFPDNSFDLMISSDVFEHVADYKKSFAEAYRCLKAGGRLVFFVPFDIKRDKNVLRSKVNEHGETIDFLPRVFHGNPLSEEGSLVFVDYGWELLDVIRKMGFSDVFVHVYFSAEKGYLGEQFFFEAVK